MNPVFELDRAPKDLARVTIDGMPLARCLRVGWRDALDESLDRRQWSNHRLEIPIAQNA
jgi:hypothetical protein